MGCHQAKTLPTGPTGAKSVRAAEVDIIPFSAGWKGAGVAFAAAYELVHKEKMFEEACHEAKVILTAVVSRSHGQLRVVCTKLSGDFFAEWSFQGDATIWDLRSEIASRCVTSAIPQLLNGDNFVEPGSRIEQFIDTPLTIYMDHQEALFKAPGRAGGLGCKRVLRVIGSSIYSVGEQAHCFVDVVFTAGLSNKAYCQRVELMLLRHDGACTYTVSSAALLGAATRQSETRERYACGVCFHREDPSGFLGNVGGLPTAALCTM